MNPLFNSQIIEMSFHSRYLECIAPNNKSYLLPLSSSKFKEALNNNNPLIAKKIIQLFNQCSDIKGVRRDLIFINKNLFYLKNIISNLNKLGGDLTINDEISLQESSFKHCIVSFISFFTASEMCYKFDKKIIFKDEMTDIFEELLLIRNKIIAHREYYKNDMILFNFNKDFSKLYLDGYGPSESFFFLFASYRNDFLLEHFIRVSTYFLSHIEELYINKLHQLEEAVNLDANILAIFRETIGD